MFTQNRPRGPEGEASYSYTLFLTSALDGVEWSTPCSGRFTPVEEPVPIVSEAGWAPGPVWAGVENLAVTEIRSPEHPARSKSIYRLSYPGPHPTRKPATMSTTLYPVSHNYVSMGTEVWYPRDTAVEDNNEWNVWSYNLDPPYTFIICIRKTYMKVQELIFFPYIAACSNTFL
jgi:hypothetical protein